MPWIQCWLHGKMAELLNLEYVICFYKPKKELSSAISYHQDFSNRNIWCRQAVKVLPGNLPYGISMSVL